MDQTKIGAFIARKRKERDLTQLRFAELVGVSDKTVSKWETGVRMPDVEMIQKVCTVLEITINELLAGEEFPDKEYRQRTEDNVIGLVQELDEIRERKVSRYLGVLCSALAVLAGMLFTMAHIVGAVNMALFFHIPTLFYMAGLFLLILGVTGAFTRYTAGYKCWLNIRTYHEKEMKKIICTVEYANKITVMTALFVALTNGVGIGIYFRQLEETGAFLAGIILSFFYMAIMGVVHAQILYRCKMIIADMRHSVEDNQ